jgi:hypothetical protein
MRFVKAASFVMLSVVSQFLVAENIDVAGEIADTQCATNVHSLTRSHDEIVAKIMGANPADCARKCVRAYGGKYVLLVGDKVYPLASSTVGEKYAGQKVHVAGDSGSKNKSLEVAIDLAAEGSNLCTSRVTLLNREREVSVLVS